MKTTIYIEGGRKRQLNIELRAGFRQLFEKMRIKPSKIVACGMRGEAFKDFCLGLKTKSEDESVILLIDSEGLITVDSKVEHIRQNDKWSGIKDMMKDKIFFMVVMMESWFLSDTQALKNFFGSKFDETKLPKQSDFERIDKDTLNEGLRKSTQKTTKGVYDKGKHSFKILALLDGDKVAKHGKYAREFFDYLKNSC